MTTTPETLPALFHAGSSPSVIEYLRAARRLAQESYDNLHAHDQTYTAEAAVLATLAQAVATLAVASAAL